MESDHRFYSKFDSFARSIAQRLCGRGPGASSWTPDRSSLCRLLAVGRWIACVSILTFGCRAEPDRARGLFGALLGATPVQVRAALPPGGRLVQELSEGAQVFRWRGPDGDPVTFEFHSGLLVAIRMGPAIVEPADVEVEHFTSSVYVTELQRSPGRAVRTHLIARDCPVHAEEVRSFIGRATKK